MATNYNAYYLFSTQMYWWEYNGGDTGTAFQVGNDAVFGVSKGAMRFENITVAQGTTVYDAQIFIWVGLKSGSNIKIKMHGIDEDNTSAFGSNPFGRPQTTAYSLLDDSIPSSGQWRSINATDSINEILARSGWASGNAMGFAFQDNSSSADSWIFDASSNHGSLLFIKLAADPDFTPTPTGVLAPSFPIDPKYGIKISNINAKTATSKQLYYFSGKKELQTLKRLKLTETVPQTHHTLPYLPCAIGYFEDANGMHMAGSYLSQFDVGVGTLYVNNEYVFIYPGVGKFAYVYVFIDPLG